MSFNRRQFLGFSAFTAVAGGLVSSIAQSEERRRARGSQAGAAPAASGPAGYPLLDPNNSAAKAVNYIKSHGDLKDAKLKMERQGVAWEQQFCNNCSFYKEVTTKDGQKAGTCTIFANQLVLDKAWCTSWNKKA